MVWHIIDTHPEYEVSTNGSVRRKEANHRVDAGHLLKPYDSGHNLSVTLYRRGLKSTHKVHTLVAVAFLPPKPSPVHMIAHNNGDYTDNRIENIRWATCKENLDDRKIHGTELRGQRNGRCKLTTEQVLEIRRRYKPRCPLNGANVLAKEFGVTDVAVIKAYRGENWAVMPLEPAQKQQ